MKRPNKLPAKFGILTHNDMDGVGCAIMINQQHEDQVEFTDKTGYERLSDKIAKMAERTNAIIITDLMLEQHEIDLVARLFDWVLWIDHHKHVTELNIPFPYIHDQKYCGTYLTAAFLKSIGKLDMTPDIKNLIDTINDYDLFHLQREDSLWLNEVFYELKFWGFVDEFRLGYDGSERWKAKGKKLLEDRMEEIRKYFYIETDLVRYTFANTNVSVVPLTFPEYDYHMIIRGPRVVSVRSKHHSLEPFYEMARESLEVFNVGGHEFAGGIALARDYVDDMDTVMDLFYQYAKGAENG